MRLRAMALACKFLHYRVSQPTTIFMMQPTLSYVSCASLADPTAAHHAMAYWQWGNPAAGHVIVCVHGLSRQGRDFDVLARALVARAQHQGQQVRVVCPDVVGRGQSEWLADPAGYQISTYAHDVLTLLARLEAEAPVTTLDWVGTSMGGLIGMAALGSPQPGVLAPVRKLVLNDVGPTLEWTALQRIGTYLGRAGEFASVQAAAEALWAVSSSFGPHTPEQWRALCEPMLRPVQQADTAQAITAPRWQLHYDPAIALPFRSATEASTAAGQAALWHLYEQITADTLILRGATSDLLSKATAEDMMHRGPKARLVELDGVGHAPTLVAEDQVTVVTHFLFGDA